MVKFQRLALPLLAMVIAFLFSPSIIDPCRTDPIFSFTDGSRVTVTASVNAAVSTIKHLDYRLHVPHGLVVAHVESTGVPRNATETYAVIDDQLPGSYSVAILITGTGHAAAMTSLLQANGQSITGSGTTGTSLHLHTIHGASR
ncbi:MAG: hypothetical protein H0X37_11500 [Herpetosiphonaceae bacterium]|nr:hypothetical protein [Herpetosiphonaceae bacterium]